MINPSLILLTLFFVNGFYFLQCKNSLKFSTKDNCCSKVLQSLLRKIGDYFGQNSFVHLVFSEETMELCIPPEITVKWQVMVTCPQTLDEKKIVLSAYPSVYVLMINNYLNVQQLEEIVNKLERFLVPLNRASKFLVITSINLVYAGIERNHLAMNSFNYLWKKNIFNVAMLVSESEGNNLTLFSSSPYSSVFKTCKEITTFSQLQEISLMTEDLIDNMPDTKIVGYNLRNLKDFYGCPIKAYTYHFPPYSVAENRDDLRSDLVYKKGIETEIVQSMAKIYNMSLHVKTAERTKNKGWRYKLPNGSIHNVFLGIITNDVDIAFAGAVPTPGSYYFLEHVFTQMMDSMSWYVPAGEPLPSWHLISGALTIPSWLLLLVACTLFFLWYRTVSRLTKEKPGEPVGLLVIRILLGISTHWTPRMDHLRLLVLTWNLFSLNLSIMFSTRLFSVLTNPLISPGVRSLEELHKSRMKTCISYIYRYLYLNKTDFLVRKLLENWSDCDNMENGVKNILKHRDFSILGKDDYISFLMDVNESRIHKLTEKFITYPVTMFLSRGSVLTKPLTRAVIRSFNGGLFHKWLFDVRRHVKVSFKPEEREKAGATESLQNDVFIWLYILYLSGLFIASVAFIVELHRGHMNIHNQKQMKKKTTKYWSKI